MPTAQGEWPSPACSSSRGEHLPTTLSTYRPWEKRLGLWVVTLALPAPRPGTADLLSSLEDLELNNRRLAGENAKLQRSVETAEEGSARLGEEISALRKQLRRWAGPRSTILCPVSLLTTAPASLSAPPAVTLHCPFLLFLFYPSLLCPPGSSLSTSRVRTSFAPL